MPFSNSSFVQNGTFTSVQEIGQGAGTVVYRAYYVPRNRPVAIKAVAAGRPDAAHIQLKLIREYQVAKALRHPQIICAYALLTDQAQAENYLVCEYADGGSLIELLAREGCIAEAMAVGYALDICAALAELMQGQRQIVHRDVKPSNILLATNDQGKLTAKLADFGAAQDQLSQTRTAMKGDKHPGTPQYMAPEQNDAANPVDIRADIFALGATLWELLAGAPLKQPGGKQRPALRRLNAHTSVGVAAVIARATAHNPDQRYRTPQELAADLQAVRARRMPTAMRRTIGRRISVALSATTLLMALGLGSLFMMNATTQNQAGLAATQTQAAAAQASTATWVAGQVAQVGDERTAMALTSTAMVAEATASSYAERATGTTLAATIGAGNAAATATAVAATQTVLAHEAETANAISAEQTAEALRRASDDLSRQQTAESIAATQTASAVAAEQAAQAEAIARQQTTEAIALTQTAAARQREADERARRQTAEAIARQQTAEAIALTQTAAARQREADERARSQRLITVRGQMYIEDDETFGSNERGTFPFAYDIQVSPDTPTGNPDPFIQCVGGEVRAELYLTVQLQPDARSVQVSANVRLFEGTSCDTNKLRDEETLIEMLGEGSGLTYTLGPRAPAGDLTDVTFDVFNSQQ